MRESQGQAIRLADYKKPDYNVLTVDLDVNLHPSQTHVKSTLLVERAKGVEPKIPFRLDGDEIELVRLSVEGRVLSEEDYRINEHSLTITRLPSHPDFQMS